MLSNMVRYSAIKQIITQITRPVVKFRQYRQEGIIVGGGGNMILYSHIFFAIIWMVLNLVLFIFILFNL